MSLKEVLPLGTPLKLMIDPTNACNFRCDFCPTGHEDLLAKVNRPKGIMDLSLYRKIIDDLLAFKSKIKSLFLHKDGEPFLNKNLANMIAYAKKQDIADSVIVTTNASLMSPEKSQEIIGTGLDEIRISIEHISDDGYKERTKIYSDYSQILNNVSFLFKEKENRKSHLKVHVKILDTRLTDSEKEKFISDFSPISDSLNIDSLMGWSLSNTRDFTLDAPDVAPMSRGSNSNWKVCSDPFYGLAINFDGTVSVCCVDWSHDTLVGDTKKESVYDIWHGKLLYDFRMTHLIGNKDKIKSCNNCHYFATQALSKRIDEYAPALLSKYKKYYQYHMPATSKGR